MDILPVTSKISNKFEVIFMIQDYDDYIIVYIPIYLQQSAGINA